MLMLHIKRWIILILVSVIILGSTLATTVTAAQPVNHTSLEPPFAVQNSNTSSQDGATTIMSQASNRGTSRVIINPETGVPDGAILLTVFLKHDQSKTVNQILEELKQSGYWTAFPPEGVEVVSWYVVMGLGQVVTLAVPPDRLRAVNLAIERTAWRAYRTEVYPTYDFSQAAQRLRQQELQRS